MDEIILKLSADQAYTLRMILDSVSGHYHTRRLHAAEISDQLIAQNVPYAPSDEYDKLVDLKRREIRFIGA